MTHFIVDAILVLLIPAAYFVGVNRNRANARKELEAIEEKAGEKGAAILAAIKDRLGL